MRCSVFSLAVWLYRGICICTADDSRNLSPHNLQLIDSKPINRTKWKLNWILKDHSFLYVVTWNEWSQGLISWGGAWLQEMGFGGVIGSGGLWSYQWTDPLIDSYFESVLLEGSRLQVIRGESTQCPSSFPIFSLSLSHFPPPGFSALAWGWGGWGELCHHDWHSWHPSPCQSSHL